MTAARGDESALVIDREGRASPEPGRFGPASPGFEHFALPIAQPPHVMRPRLALPPDAINSTYAILYETC